MHRAERRALCNSRQGVDQSIRLARGRLPGPLRQGGGRDAGRDAARHGRHREGNCHFAPAAGQGSGDAAPPPGPTKPRGASKGHATLAEVHSAAPAVKAALAESQVRESASDGLAPAWLIAIVLGALLSAAAVRFVRRS